MKFLLVTYPSGDYDIIADRWNPDRDTLEVVEVPSLKGIKATDAARMVTPDNLKEVLDYGHLVGWGKFSLLTAEKLSAQAELRRLEAIIRTMERALTPLQEEAVREAEEWTLLPSAQD